MARGDTLAPEFRFHPTDEELIRYYLKRKVTNKPFRFDPISVVDIYKIEPWDLPDTNVKYPFLKQASHMLGGIPAPPSLASEFPIKDAALRLNAAQASSSVRVTAGMIRIENMTLGGNGMDWPFGKNGTVNIILSFGLPEGDVSRSTLTPMTNFLSGKTSSIVSRSWLFLIFFWVLILSVSCKIGTHICGKLSGQ